MSMFQTITFNLKTASVRNQTLAGRKYIVCPMVMMTEGVHSGSKGALYYPNEELEKALPAWNHKPIVVYHPEKGSAADPEVLNKSYVGMILNTKWDGKQRAEAWFDEDRLDSVDDRIGKAVRNKKMMELSTGLYVDVEDKEDSWKGEKYAGVARNHRPDHLALLPDKVGACSIKDGAGLFQLNEEGLSLLLNDPQSLERGLYFALLNDAGRRQSLVNELSHSQICRDLFTKLRERYPDGDGYVWRGYIEDVFGDYFIWCDGQGGTWKQLYSTSDTGVELEGDPEAVQRSVQYVSVPESDSVSTYEEKDMAKAKKETVDKLIANTGNKFDESDRDALMTLTEEQLAKFEAPAEKKEEKKEMPPVVTPAANTQQQQDQQTFEALLAKAPAAIQRVIANGIAMEKLERERLIGIITSAPGAVYNAEELKDRDINDLFKLAKVIENAKPANQQQALPQPSYLGLGLPVGNSGVANRQQQEENEETPMDFPTLNFEQKKKKAS